MVTPLLERAQNTSIDAAPAAFVLRRGAPAAFPLIIAASRGSRVPIRATSSAPSTSPSPVTSDSSSSRSARA